MEAFSLEKGLVT